MTDIFVGSNGARVVESNRQLTLIAGEDILPGSVVRVDTATGKFVLANAATQAASRAYGIAAGSKVALSGFPITAVRVGVIAGFEVDEAYDADIYLSDLPGSIANSAGTVSVVLGRVIPGGTNALGSANAKLIMFEVK